MKKTFYVTTPIYYVNDAPHIGHSYTTVLADVLNRYHRLAGDSVYFLTGTDEHGQKVQQAAEAKGLNPQAHCDLYSERFRQAWTKLNIGYDDFIRTTDPKHKAYVQKILSQLWEAGQIYANEYEGWYSTGEERFFTEKELVDGKDPISGRPVEKIREKNYFFKMSTYQTWLIEYIQQNPDFILPDFRRNEVLGFLRQPLNDLCISRPKSRLSWGVTLPFDEDYVAYVWVDALFNYCSAVDGKTHASGERIWPASCHLIGKDILTTHAVYWPTLLKAVGYPLPKHILAHGWWLIDNARMSKTTGNVVDPFVMAEKYGVDEFRYFLIRDMVLGQDASFSETGFVLRLNSDLANDLGNGLSRILKLSQALQGNLEVKPSLLPEDIELRNLAINMASSCLEKVAAYKLSFAVEDILQVIRAVNKYLENTAPWKLVKQGADNTEAWVRLQTVLFHGAETLRLVCTLMQPIMPVKMETALKALGFTSEKSLLHWGLAPLQTQEISPLFPRIHDGLEKLPGNSGATSIQPTDPFSCVQLKVAEIVAVEDHPNAESLYKLQVRVGEDIRTVCAGLKKYYTPEALLHHKVILVANLKPANLRGVESAGMILAADLPEGRITLIQASKGESGEDIHCEGISSIPKPQLTLKEFEKCRLSIKEGKVQYANKPLLCQNDFVFANAPDGASVH